MDQKFAIRLVSTEILSIILMDKKRRSHRDLVKNNPAAIRKISVSTQYNMSNENKLQKKICMLFEL
ncbi:hypothetical protein B9T26_05480 [Acinetobacter sp. ANC 4169]|nr:hypothetical protein B9T26_05480 [Acinetobacter sp. ANC 4169]